MYISNCILLEMHMYLASYICTELYNYDNYYVDENDMTFDKKNEKLNNSYMLTK